MKFEYNDFGQLTKDSQDHDDLVVGGTPKVQYAYADGSNGNTHLTKITYTNGRNLHYDYEGSPEDEFLDRVQLLSDDDGSGGVGDILADYESKRLGLDRIIQFELVEPNLLFNLAHGTGGAYDGLDRFGRVKDLLWKEGATEVVRIEHGYDRAGNRLWREDPVADAYGKNFDELYVYLCPCQLAGGDFFGRLRRALSRGTGRCSFSHSWLAA